MLPGAGRNQDDMAGSNLCLLGVDVHQTLALQDEVKLRGGFMKEVIEGGL